MRAYTGWAFGLTLCGLSPLAAAQPDPSGIEFVTVGAPGNAPWTGGGFNNNRGHVDYEYRIGKYEVTTSQWADFMNAAFDRPSDDRIPHVFAPFIWGAVGTTPNNPGGSRWTVPTGNEMLPTGGIDWRTAAIYTNWLHNGQSSDRSAFLSGAYDVSTFGITGSFFTDQLTRSPGARYWIPSLDEWMKASHFAPDRFGPGQGGWWTYSNSSDARPIYGPPGVLVNGELSTANAGWDELVYPGLSPYRVPLGAYSGVNSPWGLVDVAGATSEWTEGVFQLSDEALPRARVFEGTAWASFTAGGAADLVRNGGGGEFPNFPGFDVGFRVATAVPAPGTAWGCIAIVLFTSKRTRRRSALV